MRPTRIITAALATFLLAGTAMAAPGQTEVIAATAPSVDQPELGTTTSAVDEFPVRTVDLGSQDVTDLALFDAMPVVLGDDKVQLLFPGAEQWNASFDVPGAHTLVQGADTNSTSWISQAGTTSVTRLTYPTGARFNEPILTEIPIGVPVYGPIAFVAGAVWLLAGGAGAESPHLYRFDPTTGEVEDRSGDQPWLKPSILANPAADGTDLVVGDQTGGPFTVHHLDVADDPVTKVASGSGRDEWLLADLAATTAGTFVTAGAPGSFDEWDVATMTRTGAYDIPTGGDPRAVAFGADYNCCPIPGNGVIAGATRSPNEIFVYKTGLADPVHTVHLAHDVDIEQVEVSTRGNLYAVTKASTGARTLSMWHIGPKIISRAPTTFATPPSAGTEVVLQTKDVDVVDDVRVDLVPAAFTRDGDTITVTLPDPLDLGLHSVWLTTPFGGASVSVLVQRFTDVDADHPFVYAIDGLAGAGVTTGYPDGTFRPTATTTRQALAAMLYRAAGEPTFEVPGTPTFSDVPVTHAFFEEIEWLAAEGIAHGYPDGTFRPAGGTTRQAVVRMLYGAAGEPAFEAPDAPTFSDVPVTHPFFTEIEWAASRSITSGYEDGTFRPSALISRQALVSMVSRTPLA